MAAPVAAARLRCSYSADERGDPLAGTAAHAMGFLLIEAPGAWGQNALSESRLDPEIANLVAARAAELSYRVLLIKRPGRAAVEPRRAWAVVNSSPGAESTTWGSYASDSELLDIPLAPAVASPQPRPRSTSSAPTDATTRAVRSAAGRSRRSSRRSGPARSGSAPTSAAIGSHRTFSCSRTASTTAASSRRALLDIVTAQERAEVAVDLLRGRSVFRPPVQAAQHFARLAHGSALIDDLEPIGRHTAASGDVSVDLAHGDTPDDGDCSTRPSARRQVCSRARPRTRSIPRHSP